MTDILIRDVPEEVVARIDTAARHAGLSRVEYLRRRLAVDIAFPAVPVEVSDLRAAGDLAADLLDDDIMRAAWT